MKKEDILSVDLIDKALSSITFDVYDMKSSIEFLDKKELEKRPESRYLAWMIVLGALPEDKTLWGKSLYGRIQSYNQKIEYYQKPNGEFPEILSSKVTREIVSDVKRAQTWFTNFLIAIGLQKEYAQYTEKRIIRVITIVIKEMPQCQYLQGYDRFAAISYGISLAFSLKIGLSLLEAEAFSINLLRKIISVNNIDSNLNHASSIMNYFQKIDGYLRSHNPEIMQCLAKQNCGSVDFASNWCGVFFVDNHHPKSFLLIWDSIILNRGNFEEFLNALVSAHLNQVPLKSSPFEQLQAIQEYPNWDVKRIVQEAENLLIPPTFCKNSMTGILGFWI
ncbi:hypothetical protein GPJ56_003826 [Histomonas meleagridis]|uniref:uncharacterized protein n=1 Tax=Histomonas meleagridis TaxID=135588 RepID=UPI00355A6A03|nr:hypothetical protein GPJ56_003826 [Histomonas meleagridis]KAH0805284.1 hypothetical protein GO595_002229 [Histomonas meleagridis]